MKFRKYITYVFLWSQLNIQCAVSMQPHECWWDANTESMGQYFEQWFGDCNSSSRVLARKYIKREQYRTILDIACSLGTEFVGLQQDGMSIAYLGMDISPKLVELAQKKHIPAIQGSIENIPCDDSSFDICYARHILEHLPYYEKAINELIRVAKKEVLIVFFIKPNDAMDTFTVNLDHNHLLYANHYNRDKLEYFVDCNAKVKTVKWEDVDEKEAILHIYVK